MTRRQVMTTMATGTLASVVELGSAKAETRKNTGKIVIGADPFAVDLKDDIAQYLTELGIEYVDVGTIHEEKDRPYYDVAKEAAQTIQAGEAQRGILFCGTGMGMSVVANKFQGITACVVESVYAAHMCRAINNSNVLTMGAMFIAPWKARKMVDAWLNTTHTQGLDEFAGFLRQAVKEVEKIDRMAIRGPETSRRGD